MILHIYTINRYIMQLPDIDTEVVTSTIEKKKKYIKTKYIYYSRKVFLVGKRQTSQ